MAILNIFFIKIIKYYLIKIDEFVFDLDFLFDELNLIKTLYSYYHREVLVSGCLGKTIKLWGLETGSGINTLLGHRGSVYSLVIIPFFE